MPFVLLAIGLLLIVTSVRGTVFDLGRLVVSDFTGQPNFFYWIIALFIIGALGYIEELQAPSRMLLVLVLVALVLANRGFFNKFVEQLKAGSNAPPPPTTQQKAATAGGGIAGGMVGPGMGMPTGGGASSAGGSMASTAASLAPLALMLL